MKKFFSSLLGYSLSVFFINSAWGQANYLTPYAITTIVGTPGVQGSADGTNGAASFSIDIVNLCGLAVDTNSGSVYVADTGNSTIRRLTPVGTNWVVTTIAGQPGVTGNADGTNNTATFDYPIGLTMDASGNLYVLDTENFLVREISPLGTNWVTKTLAAFTDYEWAITCDKNGNLYTVSFTGIQEISPTNNWQVVPIATNVTFNDLEGITVDTNGNLYVVDEVGPDVQKLTLVGTNWVVTTIAGMSGVSGYADGTNNSATFNQPKSIALDNQGNLYVTDTGGQTMRKIAPVGANWVVSTLAGISGGTGSTNGAGINARFNYPAGLALDARGNFYVGDTGDDTIRKGSVAKLPLTIARSGPNTNLVSWPSAASYSISGGVPTATNWIGYSGAGHTLQRNGNLQPTNWANYTGAVTTTNGTNSAIITPVTGSLFFRLIQ